MLDTLLEIGRVLRESPDGLKHHRYIKPAPVPSEANPVVFWTVPVAPYGSFDFQGRVRLENESKQRNLFYLNYKTSDADSLKKYVLGDIYRTLTKTGEDGNFRLGDPNSGASAFRVNSFLRGEADALLFQSDWLNSFREAFRQQLDILEAILIEEKNIYLHFDIDGQAWHQRPELQTLNDQMLTNFSRETSSGHVLQAYLYKTILSSHSATPGFGVDGDKQHRLRAFASKEQLLDLIYAIDLSTRSVIRKDTFKLIVLPRSEKLKSDDVGLTAEVIERFFRLKNLENIAQSEEQIETQLLDSATDIDEIFAPVETEAAKIIPQFDFIFSKAGSSASTPDADMIEISGLRRSKLAYIAQGVRRVRDEVQTERDKFFTNLKKPLEPLSIIRSFLNLLGDTTRAKKKYQSHLFSVLPQIYTETYFRDPVLLPALIEKSEFALRDGRDSFPFIRFDFLFLTGIQREGESTLMKIIGSPSYKLGLLLGTLARPLRTRINSFDKNYAGLLSRRIGNLSDVMAFTNELNQKLIMHDCVGFTHATSQQAALSLRDFSGRYDKDECAFGFFESYYAPIPKKESNSSEADLQTVE